MGALAATLLPAAVGLALVGLAGPLERRLGAAAAHMAAARAALAAGVLAILLLWQAIGRGQIEQRFEWLGVGRTTTIDWLVQLDPLALLLIAVALLALALGVVADLAFGTARGARPPARIALAAGAALLLASAGTTAQLAIAAGLMTLALRAWPNEHAPKDLSDRTWLLGLVGVGLGAAGLAWLAAAGDLDLTRLERAAFGQGRSELVRGRIGGPFGGLGPAVVATIAAGAAALAWALAWPRLLARAWAEGPAPALVAAGAGLSAIAVILLRTQLALAMAPTALAALTLAATATAAWAGARAARATTSARVIAAGGQATLAIAVAAIAIGEPVAAAQLLAVAGLAWAALTAGLKGPRRPRIGLAGAAGIGLVATLGAALAGLWSDLSAWSPGLNAIASGLLLVGAGGLAVGVVHVLSDRTDPPGWPRPEAPGLLLGVGVVLALAAAVLGCWPLGRHLWPVFVAARGLEGAYALGPRPDGLVFGTGVGVGLVAAAVALGAGLAGRIAPAPRRTRRQRAGADGPTSPRLLRLGERLVGRLTLWPGDERVAVAPGRFDVRAPLLAAIAGALAIVGSVFCNPDVVVLGPTRVHPVDLGGLDALMVGVRRAAPEEAAGEAARRTRPDGGQGEDIGPAPLGGPREGVPGDMSEEAGPEREGAGAEDRAQGEDVAGDMSGRAGDTAADDMSERTGDR